MATYPNSILVKGDVINEVDDVDQNDHNILKGEIVALQTYIGTNPHGSQNNMVERVGYMIDTNGGLQGSNAFPDGVVVETFKRMAWFRDDLNVWYIRNSANDTWIAQGASLSNYLFGYTGVFSTQGVSGGEIMSSNRLETTLTGQFRYLYATPSAFLTVWQGSWVKISGVNTITPKAYVWQSAADLTCFVQVAVESLSSTAFVIGSTIQLATLNTIDVSGLNNGTTYRVSIALKTGGGGRAICGQLDSFGS